MSSLPIDLIDDLKKMPQILYRGDQAKRICRNTGKSMMVDCYQQQGLYTNLICNGNPLEVSRVGIRQSVCNHINSLAQSHYLSFSEDRRVAELFAKGLTGKNLQPTTASTWDSVVFSFQTSQVKWSIKGVGMYFGSKKHRTPPYINGITQMALIDCVKLLHSMVTAGQVQFQQELAWARRDKEWLLIPLDPMPPGNLSHIGHSAQLLPGLVTGDHFDLI